jgi:hypothetical protein
MAVGRARSEGSAMVETVAETPWVVGLVLGRCLLCLLKGFRYGEERVGALTASCGELCGVKWRVVDLQSRFLG